MLKHWLVIVGVTALLLLPYLIYGESFDSWLSLQGVRELFLGFGNWAWTVGIILLMADLLLPIPSTIVMSALGLVYGWFWGGLVASVGSFLAGMLGYVFCHYLGRRLAILLVGEEGLLRAHQLLERYGVTLVLMSRALPLLPEAVSCLAGLVKMPLRSFVPALAVGALVMGFLFAAVGELGQVYGNLALSLSVILPIVLWLLTRRFFS
jgi:uncharacterized membrane protein YdjX (TVP38/TMEM64 family)